jgi:hypothetical protein
VKREVLSALKVEIQALISHAPAYVDGYVDSLLSGRQRRPGPGEMHGKATELIREIALDVLVTRR